LWVEVFAGGLESGRAPVKHEQHTPVILFKSNPVILFKSNPVILSKKPILSSRCHFVLSSCPTGEQNGFVDLIAAATLEQVAMVRCLFEEYAAWLRLDLSYQGFSAELADLPGAYAPPRGRLFLATHSNQLAGCVALRPIAEEVCEMKRLFVRPAFHGKSIGRRLIESALKEAREIGYKCIRLDTLPPRMNKAIALYRRLGFREIEPYYENPVEGALFMELDL